MNRLIQTGKRIQKTKLETDLNTRRIQATFPLVERKLDILSTDHDYSMDFPLTKHSHSVNIILRVKPDNCCDCDPGRETGAREAVCFFDGYVGPSPYPYEQDVPAEYPAKIMAPLAQTNTYFNRGYTNPWVYPIYVDYPDPGYYAINPAGGIKVPTDGVYSVLFQTEMTGYITGSSEVVISIRKNSDPALAPETEEVLSKRTYSVFRNNLGSGSHISWMLEPRHLIQYATCVNLNEGDIVGGWLKVTNINNFSAGNGGGLNNDNNNMKINLLGLGYGFLIGYVFDNTTKEPIIGATVSYDGGFGGTFDPNNVEGSIANQVAADQFALTDEFGAYGFYTLRPATYNVTASRDGYTPLTRIALVSFNETTQMDFNLTHV
jgi:hypothetical protein